MSHQLSLFDVDSETKLASLSNIDSEVETAKFRAIERFLNNGSKETIACVNKYRTRASQNYYFRLSYRQGKKMKHIHIPGGNVRSELATYRANKLQAMIDRGAELAELLAAIAMYRGGVKSTE